MMEMPASRRVEVGRMRCFIILVGGVELQLLIDHMEDGRKSVRNSLRLLFFVFREGHIFHMVSYFSHFLELHIWDEWRR